MKVWYWQKDKHRDQWNKTMSPEIDPYKYSQLILDKDAKAIYCRKYKLFTRWCWNNWMSICKNMNLSTYLIVQTKFNSKWTTELNVKSKTIKISRRKSV